jgi:hypothetical protein
VVNRVIADADRPAAEPKNSSNAGNIMYRKDTAMPTMLASGGDQTPAEDRQLTA